MRLEQKALPLADVPPAGPLRCSYPREQLKQTLTDYQTKIGNTGAAVERSLSALCTKNCVVGGQQVGLMGGPSMVFLKALSVIQLARELDAVPIFWAATEDHDVDEVSWATLLGPRGDLDRYRVDLPHGQFVEDLPLLPEYVEVITQFAEAAQITLPPLSDLYGEAMIQILLSAFPDTGLLVVEPYLLRELAAPLVERALKMEFPPLPEGPLDSQPTYLFYKGEGGRRLRVDRPVPVELLSTGAPLRPILQSQLIPTAAYVAGPTEIAYHHQLQELFRQFDVPMPQLYRRLSATFLDQKPEDNPHRWRNLTQPRSRPQERILSWWNFKGQEALLDLTWQPNTELVVHL